MGQYENAGNFLKTKRIEAGLTQSDVASRLEGVHSQFVSNWERGLCNPPMHCLKRLAVVLKFTADDRDNMFEALCEDARHEITRRFKGIV